MLNIASESLIRLKKMLTETGFSERQGDVYLALLQLGRGTVSEIARKANINRTTGYDILDNLIEKGLISISGKEPKQEYVAETPDRLRSLLKKESQKATLRERMADELIPELRSIHNIYGKPKVMFYEGEGGLEKVYEDTLTSHEAIRAYANVEDMHAALPNYFPNYYERRARKGISIRAIVPWNTAGSERADSDTEEARETVLIPADRYYFSPEINIYDDKVMIASWRERLGIIIQSKEIADAMKSVYELAWSEAKRIDVRNNSDKKKEV